MTTDTDFFLDKIIRRILHCMALFTVISQTRVLCPVGKQAATINDSVLFIFFLAQFLLSVLYSITVFMHVGVPNFYCLF
jgi:hypothetical protein